MTSMCTRPPGPQTGLLPRAALGDVLRGRAPLFGSRLDPNRQRGFLSPVEGRLAMGIPYGDLSSEEATQLEHGSRVSMLLRLAAAHLLGARGGGVLESKPFVVSAALDNLTVDEALDAILAPARSTGCRMVFFAHAHALNLAAFDRSFAMVLASADHVLPDGIGIRLAARLLGKRMRHNINGTDLLPLLCQRSMREGRPLVLIGGAPGVADECAARLRQQHPGLDIRLVHHGFLDDDASDELARRVGAIEGAIVLVGMGSPLQERWVLHHLAGVSNITAITVGGLFDFFSGRVPRAPMAWREVGLEWLYRLLQEPRRMAKRYLLGNPLFLALTLLQRFGLHGANS
jgi:N-acetylglucosaminyldiphosphoundecaprenol N-acetyl-beta-D-mannosaminyltransferase